ncbi:MAG: hypothetical protein AABO57_06990 [Acidobacteriota bacterium]
MLANIKPLPEYVKRITTANVGRGEIDGAFQIWPTAQPAITVEPGERVAIALRIKALAPEAGSLKLAPDAPDTWKLRREGNGGDYWLDIPIGPASESSSRVVPFVVELSEGRSREIRVRLTVSVPAENLVATPRSIDFGEISLASPKGALKRVGVRKIVGSFHIKALSSTLPFLKVEQATIIEGSNYIIRVTIDPTKSLKTGIHEGVILIETDEGKRLEVPVKVKLIDR